MPKIKDANARRAHTNVVPQSTSTKTSRFIRRRSTSAAALFCAACAATAQTPAPQPPAQLPPVVVTGNPLASDLFEMVPPVSTLEGARLEQNRQPTLGEMLSILPGVNSTYFGPNASRPVIRGFDGDRIRILQNGIGILDASATSPDHAVPVDTLTVKRVEVVRGPATLLYGPSALGGVVNVIDGRIPDTALEGVTGGIDLHYASPANERGGAATSDIGSQGFVLHGDVSKARTDDLKIPGFARSPQLRAIDPRPPDEEPFGTLPNSASDSSAGAIGASYVGNKGYLGASYQEFRSDYGTVAEEDVTIRMKQRRFTLAGQWNEPLDWIKDVKVNFQHTNYHHTEFASGEAGTTFQNNGWEGRIDVHHNKVNGFEGAFGVQLADFDFSALGEEAFIPPTHTKSVAGFGFEQTKWNDWTFQAGARIDSTEIKADEAEAFGPADKRTFTTGGVSFGVLYPLGPDYVIAASVVGTERPPNYQELYSNGPHLATGQFLIGDRNLGVEKSAGFDVSLRKRHGPVTGSVAFFYYRFKDFINQIPTGEVNEEFDIPIFVYEATRAQFYGFEFEGRYLAGHYGPGDLSFEVQGDYVWAVDLDSSQPLPRISPLRVGGAIVYGTDIWSGRLELMGVRAQNRVTENELPTSGYAMLNASLDYKLGLPKGQIYAFVKGTNLLDQDARNHVSVLNQIAPMGKRGVTVGLRGTF